MDQLIAVIDLKSFYASCECAWNNGVTNLNQIKAGLQNEGYYMVGGTIKGTDGDSVAWSMFKDLRNYIIKKETAENDSFVALLENETSLILNRGMPDGLNGERPDDGNHHERKAAKAGATAEEGSSVEVSVTEVDYTTEDGKQAAPEENKNSDEKK